MGADALPDEVEALPALAEECSLGVDQAQERVRKIVAALESWRQIARERGVPESEITTMAESIEERLQAAAALGRR